MSNSVSLFPFLSVAITSAALIGYINLRLFKLPTTIAIMSGSLLFSLLIIIIGNHGFEDVEMKIYQNVAQIDFHDLLMQGMLSFLLFAGAQSININHLKQCKWEIAVLSSFTTISSAFLIAGACYYILPLIDLNLPFIYCLLFGALISPTDPIAVLAIFKDVGAPDKLNVTVSGESLFNDGVGIVLFLTLYRLAFDGGNPTAISVSLLFLREAIGGIGFGVLLGIIGHGLIKPLHDIKVELLITLAMTTGGYTLANYLGVSGPLAMVAAGIFIGNKGRSFHLNRETQKNIDNFWELIDEILNAILFFLIGIELLVITHHQWHIMAGFIIIPIVLAIRFITVLIPISIFKLKREYPANFVKVLVWGGLRGGLAVALALSLPANHYRGLILTMTYAVVVFAVIIQGLTIKFLIKQDVPS